MFVIKKTEERSITKNRIVAKGYQTKENGITYAPVASITLVSIVISISIQYSMNLIHIDAEIAFLNEILSDNLKLKENKVLKLRKSIYGLKQFPKN